MYRGCPSFSCQVRHAGFPQTQLTRKGIGTPWRRAASTDTLAGPWAATCPSELFQIKSNQIKFICDKTDEQFIQ